MNGVCLMIASFVLAGQSNIDQWFHAGDGAALAAFEETFLALNPQYTSVEFFDASRGGRGDRPSAGVHIPDGGDGGPVVGGPVTLVTASASVVSRPTTSSICSSVPSGSAP